MGNCNRSNMGQRECGERYDMSSCQDFALAMASVPWQPFEHVYEPDRALQVLSLIHIQMCIRDRYNTEQKRDTCFKKKRVGIFRT